jgi:glycosyl transferase family 25
MSSPPSQSPLRLRSRVISVASRNDRRQKVVDHLTGWGMSWQFFDALTGEHPRYPYDEKRALQARGRPLTSGELGCFGSHVACMIDFLEDSDDEFLLLLEDDVLLDQRFDVLALTSWMSKLGIDYLRLYSRYAFSVRHLFVIGRRSLIRFRSGPFGTQAYIISRAGAARFLGSLSKCERPIDDELDRFWHHGLPPYAIYPFPVLELETGSTIGRAEVDLITPTLGYRMERRAEALRRRAANLLLRFRDSKLRRVYLRLQGRP